MWNRRSLDIGVAEVSGGSRGAAEEGCCGAAGLLLVVLQRLLGARGSLGPAICHVPWCHAPRVALWPPAAPSHPTPACAALPCLRLSSAYLLPCILPLTCSVPRPPGHPAPHMSLPPPLASSCPPMHTPPPCRSPSSSGTPWRPATTRASWTWRWWWRSAASATPPCSTPPTPPATAPSSTPRQVGGLAGGRTGFWAVPGGWDAGMLGLRVAGWSCRGVCCCGSAEKPPPPCPHVTPCPCLCPFLCPCLCPLPASHRPCRGHAAGGRRLCCQPEPGGHCSGGGILCTPHEHAAGQVSAALGGRFGCVGPGWAAFQPATAPHPQQRSATTPVRCPQECGGAPRF